jgi:uncharacterized protein YukE
VSDRVLSTATARQAIQTMQRIIDGGLTEDIRALNREGQKLSEPNNWDGPRARQFRSEWPGLHSKLVAVTDELERLRKQAKSINDDIMRAGGSAV